VAKRKPVVKPDLSSAEQWFVRLSLLVALGISLFLAWNSFRGGITPGCGPDSDCDKVLSSRWGYIFHIPVSAWALPVYAVLLALLFRKKIPWKTALPLAMIIVLAALWFVVLQAFVLRAFCKFCMVAHIAGLAAALTLIRRNPLPGRLTIASGAFAGGVSVLLFAAQYAGEPPAPAIVRDSKTTNSVKTVAGAEAIFPIINGQFQLNLAKVPVAGPPNAAKKLVKLFDFTCHHCRDLHHLLAAFRQQHSNELAVISLPMPLDSACNPVMTRTPPDHVNACEYARLGLAVFYAEPQKFENFTEWVFESPRPPGLAETHGYAQQLVGDGKLREALDSAFVAEQIKQDIDIYIASSKAAKNGRMPQMIFEHGAAIGSISTSAQLEKILAENLGLGAAAPTPAATPQK
jgi:uncharacterized membrane protein